MNDYKQNPGFAGLAITLPKVWQCIDREMGEHLILHDAQASYVIETLVDLTESIHALGKLLWDNRTGTRQARIYNRTINNEKYYDAAGALVFIGRKIGALMNNVLYIGDQALELLETMYGHMNRVYNREPDELAFKLTRGTYKRVMDNES